LCSCIVGTGEVLQADMLISEVLGALFGKRYVGRMLWDVT